MPWIPDHNAPTYRFRPSGALEFQDRRGRYRLVQGVSVAGYFDFWGDEHSLGYYDQMKAMAYENEDNATIDRLYIECPEFTYLCDRCLDLSGIDTEWIAPSMLTWLLFPHQVGNTLIEGALVLLNRPAERSRPKLRGGDALDSHTKLLLSLMGAVDGDLSKAIALADDLPAKQAFALLEELGWQRAPQDDKDKALIDGEREKLAGQWDGMRAAMRKRTGESMKRAVGGQGVGNSADRRDEGTGA